MKQSNTVFSDFNALFLEEMFEMIQDKLHRLEESGDQEAALVIERISYLILGTLYKAYETGKDLVIFEKLGNPKYEKNTKPAGSSKISKCLP